MQTEILYQPAYSVCRVTLSRGEQIRAEAGAMVSMAGVEIETGATGGFLKSLGRSLLGGESFFQNTFTARADGAEVMLAPDLPGDIVVMDLAGEMIVQSGSYLASNLGIEVTAQWGGAKSFFGGEGLFMLKCAGQGSLILASYGAIHKVSLAAGQQYTIDSGHIVAIPAGVGFQVQKAGNWKSTILGGEGLVVQVSGPGDVYLQTRSPEALLNWLIPKIPRRSDS